MSPRKSLKLENENRGERRERETRSRESKCAMQMSTEMPKMQVEEICKVHKRNCPEQLSLIFVSFDCLT